MVLFFVLLIVYALTFLLVWIVNCTKKTPREKWKIMEVIAPVFAVVIVFAGVILLFVNPVVGILVIIVFMVLSFINSLFK